MEDKSNLKAILDDQLELQHQHGQIKQKYKENNELLRKFMDDNERENSRLKKRIVNMEKVIQNRIEIIQKLQNQIDQLNAISKAEYRENTESLRKLIDQSEQENSMLKNRIKIYENFFQDTKLRNETIFLLHNKIVQFNVESKKADQKKIRMLVKNNEKKRKLLYSEAMKWDEYAEKETEGEEYNQEKNKRFKELDACWDSSEESADEVDNEKVPQCN